MNKLAQLSFIVFILLALVEASDSKSYAETRTVDNSIITSTTFRFRAKLVVCVNQIRPYKIGILTKKSRLKSRVLYPAIRKLELKKWRAISRRASDMCLGIRKAYQPKFSARPFNGNFSTTNYFDHLLPIWPSVISNITSQEIFNGINLNNSIDGHRGYDYLLPEGTPLFAVADSKVTFSGKEQEFFCPILNRNVSGTGVELLITGANGERLFIRYAHMSNTSVVVGQNVFAGQFIGYSGNTGCSTEPHLHLETLKLNNKGNKFVPFDPYGWRRVESDPWELNPDGTSSYFAWQSSQSKPYIFRGKELVPNPQATDNSAVAITKVILFGEMNKTEESLVQLTIDPRYWSGSFNLHGYRLQNANRDNLYTFPAGSILQQNENLIVSFGPGESSANHIFLGFDEYKMNLDSECIRLVRPDNTQQYLFGVFSGCM